MGAIIKTEKRNVIPRWRSLELSASTGELSIYNPKEIILEFNSSTLIEEQKLAFQNSKGLSQAEDLLSSAYVLGVESDFKEAAKFILKKESNGTSPVVKLANIALGIEDSKISIAHPLKSDLSYNPSEYYSSIRKYKTYLKREPRNPIGWLELGRLYTLVAEKEKAKRCIDAALHLDKHNRFIVRSASRFYHHFHSDHDAALSIIKKSKFIESDPWLISAEISYSMIMGRHSKMLKTGNILLKSIKNNFINVTELASTIGTFEFNNGKLGDAKKLFNQSLLQPNDNSIAQINWLGEELQVSPYDSKSIPLAYESKSVEFYNKEKFKKSYREALMWFADEPFSTRPIRMASYLASIFLNENTKAIKIIEDGLKINPADPILLNNLVYFLVKENEIEKAVEIYNAKLAHTFNDLEDIPALTILATGGLLLYRTGYHEKGREYYLKAIELANKTKNTYIVALATCNFVKEELQIETDKMNLDKLINRLNVACRYQTEPDIILLYQEVIEIYKDLGKREIRFAEKPK